MDLDRFLKHKKAKLSNALINIGILVLTLIFSVLIFEFILRTFYHEERYQILWPWLHQELIQSSRGDKVYINKDDGLVYRVDNREVDEERYTQFSVPSGLERNKKENIYRIGVIGDSHTCGAGLTDVSNLYTKKLYELLNSENNNKVEGLYEFEVVSFCDGGLNTYQELSLLKESAVNYDLDMLVLQYCDNDIFPMRSPINSNGSYYISSKSDLILLDDKVVPALPYINKSIGRMLLDKSLFFRFVSYKLSIAINNIDNNYYSSFDAIKEMNNIANANDFPFLIINFVPASIERNYCNETYQGEGLELHENLEILTSELEIPFYNMCNYIDDFREIKSTKSPEDDHYNNLGNQKVADILENAILKKISENNSLINRELEGFNNN